MDIKKLATEFVDEILDINTPEDDNHNYARRMIEQRDLLEVGELQG